MGFSYYFGVLKWNLDKCAILHYERCQVAFKHLIANYFRSKNCFSRRRKLVRNK